MKYSGASALAVYGFPGTVSALFLSVFSGIGQAAQPVVAESFGAGRYERCNEVGKTGMITAVIFGIVSLLLCVLFPSQMVSVFMKPTSEVEQIAPYIIRVCALSFFPMAINMFVMAYLQAVAKPERATVVSLLRGLLLPFVLIYVMPVIMNGNGIWWAITAAEGIAAAFSIGFMLTKSNKSKRYLRKA